MSTLVVGHGGRGRVRAPFAAHGRGSGTRANGATPALRRFHPVGRCLRVHFPAGEAIVPIFDRAALAAGERIAGPAIVTQLDATTLVPPDWSMEVHVSGTLLLRR
jgi:N-methylhydantoinase A/oxoprolinase/acetone carboxylase beta subunit